MAFGSRSTIFSGQQAFLEVTDPSPQVQLAKGLGLANFWEGAWYKSKTGGL
jgi:hypothetical protein